MADLYTCTITEDDVRRAWRSWLGDDTAEPPLHLLADLPASFVTAAMEDAALAMLRVLLVEKALAARQGSAE